MAGKLTNYSDISLNPEFLIAPIDFDAVFGRLAPVHVEIGSGKGTFLLACARANPDVNILGIEWANKYCRHAVDRLGRWSIENVKLIRTDAATFIADFFVDESVDCFHIYFPDPWPKKRHHKRRLIWPKNLKQFHRCLNKDGSIRIATDHAEYFQHMQTVFAEFANKFAQGTFEPNPGTEPGELTGTNFERKYIKQKRPIYATVLKKIN